MAQQSREFQVFIKPVGADCNLNCRYCYYLDKAELNRYTGLKIIPDEILEKYIMQQIEASTETDVFFSWHGGEPTLAGLDFFRKVVKLQRKHKPADHNITNGIQTNATLLNDSWCKFLASESFFVGVSIDGPEELHNKFRVSRDNKGSYNKTLKGYELLRKHNVPTELLTVVNSENVKFPLETYNWIKQLGSNFLTFLPLVVKDPESDSGVSSISVPSVAFGSFLNTIFDVWVTKDIGKIKIQIIEEAVRIAFNQDHTLCIFKRRCGGVPVVEQNGDFYSCDHFVDKDHLIGNICQTTLADLLDSKRQKNFGKAKYVTLPQYCLDCHVLEMCNGECPRNRFINTPSGEPGLNYLCSGYKQFFTHIKPFVEAVANEWRNTHAF
jgi:uncharacterized protein